MDKVNVYCDQSRRKMVNDLLQLAAKTDQKRTLEGFAALAAAQEWLHGNLDKYQLDKAASAARRSGDFGAAYVSHIASWCAQTDLFSDWSWLEEEVDAARAVLTSGGL